MRQRFTLSVIGAAVLILLQFPAVNADRLFHSERLDFWLTPDGEAAGHPELRSGHVVDIHPNGPVNGALERYMINGAKSDTDYQVVLRIFSDTDCEVPLDLLPELPTALLATNAQGNAHSKWKFSSAETAGFSGFVIGVFWTLVDEQGTEDTSDDVVAYQTDCIEVAID
jgi:hypothetical protein